MVFALVMSIKLAFGRDDWRLGDDLPGNRLVELFGLFVGAVSTLLSIGGGAFVTTMLTLYGRTIQRAVGTSAGIGALIALPGAMGLAWAGWGEPGLPPFSLGYVSLIGAALMIPTSVWPHPTARGLRMEYRGAPWSWHSQPCSTVGLRSCQPVLVTVSKSARRSRTSRKASASLLPA